MNDRLKLLKFFISLGFVFISGLTFYLLSLPVATGYETSIHTTINVLFWVVLALIYLSGFIVIAVADYHFKTHSIPVLAGLLLLVLAVILTTTLPHLRGYEIWGSGDVPFHLGEIAFILEIGSVPEGFVYPGVSILTSSFNLITKVSPRPLSKLLPQVYFFGFTLSLYVLVRAHLSRTLPLLLAFLLVPFYDMKFMLIPFIQSMIFVPVILYTYIFLDLRRMRTKILLLVLFIASIFYHPMTALVVIILLFLYTIFQSTTSSESSTQDAHTPSLVGLLTVLFLIRIELQYRLLRKVVELSLLKVLRLGTRAGGSGSTTAGRFSSIITDNSVRIADIFSLVIFRFGPTVLLNCISLLASTYLLYNYGKNKTNMGDVYFILAFLTLGLLSVSALVVVPFSPSRYFPYVDILGVVVLSVGAYRYIRVKKQLLNYRTVTVATIIIIVLVASLATLYPVPSMDRLDNRQVTEQELASTDWVIKNRRVSDDVDYYGSSIGRLSGYLGSDATRISRNSSQPPPHFRYTGNSSPAYLITSVRSQMFYPTVYPDYTNQWKYTPQDYKRISSSPGYDRIYTNGEVRITRV